MASVFSTNKKYSLTAFCAKTNNKSLLTRVIQFPNYPKSLNFRYFSPNPVSRPKDNQFGSVKNISLATHIRKSRKYFTHQFVRAENGKCNENRKTSNNNQQFYDILCLWGKTWKGHWRANKKSHSSETREKAVQFSNIFFWVWGFSFDSVRAIILKYNCP